MDMTCLKPVKPKRVTPSGTWYNATLPQTAPGRWAAVAFVARHAARPQAGPAPPGAGDRTPVQDVR